MKISNTIIIGLSLMAFISSQTTGKISGSVIDSVTDLPIIGANIMILNTYLGTSSDIDGNYYLINLDPKSYDIVVSVIGYELTTYKDVTVSVNRTTNLDFKIKPAVLEGEAVIVTASQISIKKDQTGSVKNISSAMLEILPIEDVNAVINMQAGVVANHFRGGRSSEVTYLIDGVSVDESLGGTSSMITVDPSAIQDLEVITGTFNAEYGRAMSGVVNQISKEGSNNIKFSASAFYANYLSDNKDIFPGIDQRDLNKNLDWRFQVSGPILKNKILFFLNYRKQIKNNHLNGYDYFDPNNFSKFISNDSTKWYSEHTGDHVFESYCAEKNTGNAILTSTGEPVSKVDCNNYATCEMIFQACYNSLGDVIAQGGDNIAQDCEYAGGTLGTDVFYVNASGEQIEEIVHISDCELAAQTYSSQSGFVSHRPGSGSTIWRNENDALVPMNWSENISFLGKLTIKPISNLKINLLYSLNDDTWKNYSHGYKYNPYGLPEESKNSSIKSFQLNYMLSNSAFFDLRYSIVGSNYTIYNFKDITVDDSTTYEIDGYVNDTLNISYNGFSTGGQSRQYTDNNQEKENVKFDMTWQANNTHSFRFGIDNIQHDNSINEYTIRDSSGYDLVYTPIIDENLVSSYSEEYDIDSKEYSLYIQDKMEFDEMVINIGFRYDKFYPETTYPSDYRNPRNEISNQLESKEIKASNKEQISPRFGLAYQVGEEAVMHFSYGHFFQMPPLYAMFANYDRIIPVFNFQTILGNPNLEAEKTVQYEVGIWQRLNSLVGLELNLYYRDIYNLLSTTTITTYDEVKYGLYTNKDYGNVRGLETIVDVSIADLSMYFNYTLQYTRGNSDSPTQSFDFEGNNKDPVTILMPMSWDQRQTFNATLSYKTNNFFFTTTAYYNSGTAYSYKPIDINPLATINLQPNNEYKPSNYTVDFTGSYNFKLLNSNSRVKINLSVYNIFDRLNEYNVNSQTGRAGTAIITESDMESFYSNYNTIEDTYMVPTNYSTPRNFKIGVQYVF